MNKAISISINPNFENDDITLIKNRDSGNQKDLENKIENYFDGKKVAIVEKARDGLQLLLEAMELKTGDEVLMQAFTCSVVPMAIMATGAKVVYVDIDSNYNMDLDDLKKKITNKSRVVIVQHTFGMPVKMDQLLKIVDGKVKIIEDLAHGLGNSYQGKKLGNWGEAAILSFGRDKVISGVWGGAVVADEKLIGKINKLSENLPMRNEDWIKKQLNYVLWSEMSMKWYGIGIGKIMHWWAKRNKWFDEPLSRIEKSGKPEIIHKGLPGELVTLIEHQWDKLDRYIGIRQSIAKKYATDLGEKYDDSCSYLKYSIEVGDPGELRRYAASKNVFLGDWYDQVIAPKSIDPKVFGYQWGSCPVAEEKSKGIVNLPTNPNLSSEDIERVISIIKEWKSKK